MKVLISGDFAPRARLANQIENRKFSEIFSEKLREIIRTVDFSFVNFESPVVEDCFSPISKCGPNLRCTPEAVEAIKFAGFTGVTMANNHILDYGAEGFGKSVECCLEQGLAVVGVGENLADAGKTLYLEKDGKKLAVINCCEHEFSIATDSEAGANPLNPIQQFYSIQEAKKQADYVLVIVHGGHEHYQLPSPRMQETYRFFIDAGADAVVNHHQHCYSGYEVFKGKPIFYGLGNFCFDSSTKNFGTWYEGYMVEIDFGNDAIHYSLHPYVQYKDEATIVMVDDRSAFEKSISELNETIADSRKLREAAEKYYSEAAESFVAMYQPYGNRILNKLFRMHLLPSLVSKKRFLQILNYINCEAHKDKQVSALKLITK